MTKAQLIARMIGILAIALAWGQGQSLQGQVIWSENFSYPDGTSTGQNNNTANPAVDWVSNCPTCQSGDWMDVRSNILEGRDTNGPASLETETIDISAWPIGVEISVDLSEEGDMEGCPSGMSSGCNSLDWIQIEYDLDGTGYQDWSSPIGGFCSGPCAGDTYVAIGDFSDYTFTMCPIVGDSIRLRFTVQCWATGEFLRIDNIELKVQTCNPLILNSSVVPVSCNGDSDGQIILNVSGGDSPYTFSLDNGPFQGSPFFTGLAAGTYTAIVMDQNGALDTLPNIVVTQPAPLNLAVNVTPVGCTTSTGEATVIVSGGTPGYSYSWNTAPLQTDSTATGLPLGTYTVTVSDTNGCMATNSAIVGQSQPPSLTAGPDVEICEGSGANLTGIATDGFGAFTWNWSCNQAVCALDSSVDDDPLASPSVTTLYYVQVTDELGCVSNLDSLLASVLPAPIADAGRDTAICKGDTIGLIGMGSGAGPAYDFSWTPSLSLNSAIVFDPLAFPIVPTEYVLTLVSNGCTGEPDTVFVDLLPQPIVEIPDTVICRGDQLVLEAQVTDPPDTTFAFTWHGPNGLLLGDTSATVLVSPNLTTFFSAILVPDSGCSSDPDTGLVFVEQPFSHPQPVSPIEFCPGEPLEIGVESQAGYTYFWNPATGVQDHRQPLTIVAPEESVLYELLVISDTMQSENCKTQRFPVSLIDGDCLLPNVFSPNGDGINDELDFGPYFHRISLSIYDRWGNEVYSNDSYENDWDGKNQNGSELPEGVYYYVLTANVLPGTIADTRNRRAKRMNSLTLLR